MSTVTFSPSTSIFEDGTNTTLVVGSPGSGKTYFLLTVAANELIMQKKVFALDFKKDLQDIKQYFPSVNIVDINDVHEGALNPFNVLEDIDTLEIISIIDMMVGGIDESQRNYATPIVQDAINAFKRKTSRVTMFSIAEQFYQHPQESLQQLGAKMMAARETKYGKLILGDNIIGQDEYGNEIYGEPFSMRDESTIISLFGMELPDSNTKRLTASQSFNSSIVYIVTKIVKDLMVKSSYPTLFIMDEAHIAFGTQQFSDLVDQLMVLGRSLNIAVILASQSVSHYDAGIGQYLSAKFLFKSSSEDAREFLKKFGNTDGNTTIDVEDVVEEVMNFEKGDSFFIDRKNRDGFFHVISPLKDITSNPLFKKMKEQEIKEVN